MSTTLEPMTQKLKPEVVLKVEWEEGRFRERIPELMALIVEIVSANDGKKQFWKSKEDNLSVDISESCGLEEIT